MQQPQSTGSKIFHTLFLKKCHPNPTVNGTIVCFSIVGVIFIIIGIIISVINANIVQININSYEEDCEGQGANCTLVFKTPDKEIKSPIFFFYGLENFYQNHRRYMKSQDSNQLAGQIVTLSDAKSNCDPIIQNKDLDLIKLISWKNNTLDPQAIASPCGLIAKSVFNDTYELYSQPSLSNESRININQQGIAWADDIGGKFKKGPDSEKNQWINPENEHFIVWMRTSGLPDFQKLWGKIEEDLVPNTKYYINVTNNYNVKSFSGHKNIILSTAGPLGGKNEFLAIAFIVVGVICLIIAIIFQLRKKFFAQQQIQYGNIPHDD